MSPPPPPPPPPPSCPQGGTPMDGGTVSESTFKTGCCNWCKYNVV